jgi:hypothetical protein
VRAALCWDKGDQLAALPAAVAPEEGVGAADESLVFDSGSSLYFTFYFVLFLLKNALSTP